MPASELNLQMNLSYEDVYIEIGFQRSIYQLMFIFWGVIIPIIGIIGIIGNILTGIVLFRREMRSTTVYFLRTLVITDTGIIIVAILGLSVISITQLDRNEWLFTDVIYPHIFTPTNYFVMTLQTLNVWTTVAVAVERCITLYFPLKSVHICNKRNAYITIGITSIYSVAYNIPRAFATTFIECGNNCYTIMTTDFGKSYFYTVVYSAWFYTVLIFIVPLILLGVFNTLLIVKLMHMRRRISLNNTSSQENTEFNLGIVLVVIVLVFIMCQTPGLVAQFQFLEPNFLLRWTCVSNTLFVLNSSVNCLIYNAVGTKFRSLLVKIFKDCLRRRQSRFSRRWSSRDRELTTITTFKVTHSSVVTSDEVSALKEHD